MSVRRVSVHVSIMSQLPSCHLKNDTAMGLPWPLFSALLFLFRSQA